MGKKMILGLALVLLLSAGVAAQIFIPTPFIKLPNIIRLKINCHDGVKDVYFNLERNATITPINGLPNKC